MLIGLAVDDIKGVQDNAILRRQALKIQLTLESEYKLPNRWRRKYLTPGRTRIVKLGHSQFLSYHQFMEYLDPETQITINKVKLIYLYAWARATFISIK